MEKSPEYKQKVASIRHLPQETPEQQVEKRRSAKLFRMELMLDNANLIDLFITTLYGKPGTTEEEFRDLAQQSSLLAYPEAVDSFIVGLKKSQARIRDRIEAWKQSKSKKDLSTDLFMEAAAAAQVRKFRQSRFQPRSKVELGISQELNLTLLVSDEKDFKRIDNRTNVTGFYRDDEDYSFPLVVVLLNQVHDAHVVMHEVGHSENAKLIKALRSPKGKFVWLTTRWSDARDSAQLIQNEAKVSPEELALNRKRVMDYALGRAKDEILAEIRASGEGYNIDSLLRRNYLYDYFKSLGIDPNSSIYSSLWTEYENFLKDASSDTREMLTHYSAFDFRRRYDLMRWVLAQTPIEKWAKSTNEDLFYEESERFARIVPMMYRVDRRETDKLNALKQVYQICRTHQNKLLFPYIVEMERILGVTPKSIKEDQTEEYS